MYVFYIKPDGQGIEVACHKMLKNRLKISRLLNFGHINNEMHKE